MAYAAFKAMALEQNLSEQKRERNREFERAETHARLLQQPVERQQREVQEATIIGVVSPFGRDPEVVASEVAYQVRGEWEGFYRVRVPSPPDWQALQLAVELSGGSGYRPLSEVVRRMPVSQISLGGTSPLRSSPF